MAMRSVRMTLAIGLVVAVAVGVTWSPPGSAIVVEGGSECRVGRGLDPTFGTRGVANASMSATEADRFLALTIAREGRARGMTYGAGFVTRSGDQAMAIARLRRNGSFDRSFSGDGIATVNVAVGGRTAELARGVVEQSTGRVVVAGPVEHDPGATGDAARDTDVAVARVNRRGRLDRRFGENGITRLDLSTGVAASPTSFIGDTSWGLTRLRNDRLLVVAAKRAEGRTDRDFAVVKLTANGRRDRSFGTDGVVTVDVGHGDESPKQAVVQPDGKIVVSGYTSSGGVVSPVLFRIHPNGRLDRSFGTDGISNVRLLPSVAEAYDVALQGRKLVITGYGRSDPTKPVDLIAARFNADGTLDRTFGANGLVRLDVAGDEDRGRDLVVLPDGRLLIAGHTRLSATEQNGLLVLLGRNGAVDQTCLRQVDLGGPRDAFFAIELTRGNRGVPEAVVAGWKGADPAIGGNDDAAMARLRLDRRHRR